MDRLVGERETHISVTSPVMKKSRTGRVALLAALALAAFGLRQFIKSHSRPGSGEGNELRQPLGITIVGGLLVSQVFADALHDADRLSHSRPAAAAISRED